MSGGVWLGWSRIELAATMGRGWWWKVALLAVAVAVWRGWQGGGWDREAAFRLAREWSEKLGIWAIPLYVSLHTISIALCLPSAIFFETAAPLLFGFLPSVLCVFSAKILAASLSFSIGRFIPLLHVSSLIFLRRQIRDRWLCFPCAFGLLIVNSL